MTTMNAPLLDRLLDEGYPLVKEDNLEEFLGGPGVHVLFFAGDPQQHRETNDVAVVLPELVKAFPGILHPGVVAPEAGQALQGRYRFRRWPTLVFERSEGYLGEISGIRNWSDYLEQIQELVRVTPGPAPGLAATRDGERQPETREST